MSTSPYLEAVALLREVETKLRLVVESGEVDKENLNAYLVSLSRRLNAVDNSKALPKHGAYKQTFE